MKEIKLRPIMFGDCMEVCDAVIVNDGYYKHCCLIDIITGISRNYIEINGRAGIIGYLPDGNGIWYFPN